MDIYGRNDLKIEGTGLKKRLLVIEILVFFLPCLALLYVLIKNNVAFDISQLMIMTFILLIILAGLIILRQIFERFFMMTNMMKDAIKNNGYLQDIHKDSSELHEISVSFNNLMEKYEKTTNELQQRVFELFSVKELIQHASKFLNIDDLLKVLLEKSMTVTGATIGSVLAVEQEKNRFRVVDSRGLEKGPENGKYISFKDSIVQNVAIEKTAFLVKDIENDPRTSRQNDPKYGPPSFISMPIFIREDLISVLNLAHKETGKDFEQEDQEILSIMISEIGFALENAQLHMQVKNQLQELEKSSDELAEANEKLQNEMAERKQSQAVCMESEELYRDLFENANDMIQSIGPDGRFLQVNKTWREILGYDMDEIPGLSLWDTIHPDSLDHCKETLKRVFSGEEITHLEAVFLSKNGEAIPVEGNINCKTENDVPVSTRGIFRDIRLRKNAENKLQSALEQLRESNKKLEFAYSQMREWKDQLGIQLQGEEICFAIEENGKILGLTEKAVESLGKSRIGLIGKNIVDFIEKDIRDKFMNASHSALKGVFNQISLHLKSDQHEHKTFNAKLMHMHMEEGRILLLLMRGSKA